MGIFLKAPYPDPERLESKRWVEKHEDRFQHLLAVLDDEGAIKERAIEAAGGKEKFEKLTKNNQRDLLARARRRVTAEMPVYTSPPQITRRGDWEKWAEEMFGPEKEEDEETLQDKKKRVMEKLRDDRRKQNITNELGHAIDGSAHADGPTAVTRLRGALAFLGTPQVTQFLKLQHGLFDSDMEGNLVQRPDASGSATEGTESGKKFMKQYRALRDLKKVVGGDMPDLEHYTIGREEPQEAGPERDNVSAERLRDVLTEKLGIEEFDNMSEEQINEERAKLSDKEKEMIEPTLQGNAVYNLTKLYGDFKSAIIPAFNNISKKLDIEPEQLEKIVNLVSPQVMYRGTNTAALQSLGKAVREHLDHSKAVRRMAEMREDNSHRSGEWRESDDGEYRECPGCKNGHHENAHRHPTDDSRSLNMDDDGFKRFVKNVYHGGAKATKNAIEQPNAGARRTVPVDDGFTDEQRQIQFLINEGSLANGRVERQTDRIASFESDIQEKERLLQFNLEQKKEGKAPKREGVIDRNIERYRKEIKTLKEHRGNEIERLNILSTARDEFFAANPQIRDIVSGEPEEPESPFLAERDDEGVEEDVSEKKPASAPELMDDPLDMPCPTCTHMVSTGMRGPEVLHTIRDMLMPGEGKSPKRYCPTGADMHAVLEEARQRFEDQENPDREIMELVEDLAEHDLHRSEINSEIESTDNEKDRKAQRVAEAMDERGLRYTGLVRPVCRLPVGIEAINHKIAAQSKGHVRENNEGLQKINDLYAIKEALTAPIKAKTAKEDSARFEAGQDAAHFLLGRDRDNPDQKLSGDKLLRMIDREIDDLEKRNSIDLRNPAVEGGGFIWPNQHFPIQTAIAHMLNTRFGGSDDMERYRDGLSGDLIDLPLQGTFDQYKGRADDKKEFCANVFRIITGYMNSDPYGREVYSVTHPKSKNRSLFSGQSGRKLRDLLISIEEEYDLRKHAPETWQARREAQQGIHGHGDQYNVTGGPTACPECAGLGHVSKAMYHDVHGDSPEGGDVGAESPMLRAQRVLGMTNVYGSRDHGEGADGRVAFARSAIGEGEFTEDDAADARLGDIPGMRYECLHCAGLGVCPTCDGGGHHAPVVDPEKAPLKQVKHPLPDEEDSLDSFLQSLSVSPSMSSNLMTQARLQRLAGEPLKPPAYVDPARQFEQARASLPTAAVRAPELKDVLTGGSQQPTLDEQLDELSGQPAQQPVQQETEGPEMDPYGIATPYSQMDPAILTPDWPRLPFPEGGSKYREDIHTHALSDPDGSWASHGMAEGPVTGHSMYPSHAHDRGVILPLINNMTPYEIKGMADYGKIDTKGKGNDERSIYQHRKQDGWGFGHEPKGMDRDKYSKGEEIYNAQNDISARLENIALGGEDYGFDPDDPSTWLLSRVSTTYTDEDTGDERMEGPVSFFHPSFGISPQSNPGHSMVEEAGKNSKVSLNREPVEMTPEQAGEYLEAHEYGGSLPPMVDSKDPESGINIQGLDNMASRINHNSLITDMINEQALYTPNALWEHIHDNEWTDKNINAVKRFIQHHHPHWDEQMATDAWQNKLAMSPFDIAWSILEAGNILKSLSLL